jgi:hypothetical protein
MSSDRNSLFSSYNSIRCVEVVYSINYGAEPNILTLHLCPVSSSAYIFQDCLKCLVFAFRTLIYFETSFSTCEAKGTGDDMLKFFSSIITIVIQWMIQGKLSTIMGDLFGPLT